MSYAIVEFIDSVNREFDVVPVCWVENMNVCFWPPKSMQGNSFTQAVMKQLPVGANWSKHRVKTRRLKGKNISLLCISSKLIK